MSMEEYPQLPVDPERPPYRVRPLRRGHLPVLIGLLAGLVFLAVLPYMAEQFEYGITRGRERARAEVAREELAGLPDAVNRFRLAAKAIEPSVVGIEVTRLVGGGGMDDEWASFFSPGPRVGTGQGSGVIVDKDGYVVTNFHVVNGAGVVNGVAQITVRLSEGRAVRDVEVIGIDPASDLAVLRIRAPGLVAAPWGDSEQLEVGDQVLAVGSPYRLAQTVTSGIISAKDRRAIIQNLDLQDFLQTDAAINPGNSGGPLVNLRGEVIGINTAIVGEAYQGIGFAIPSKLAQDVYTRLKAGEKVPRGWLGVAMQDLNQRLAEQLKLQEAQGVLVADVVADSPAGKAGLEPGDVIVEWNGKRVGDANDLRFLVAGTRIGSAVKVVFHRNGQKREATVTVAERPSRIRR
jgi:serine protease Do